MYLIYLIFNNYIYIFLQRSQKSEKNIGTWRNGEGMTQNQKTTYTNRDIYIYMEVQKNLQEVPKLYNDITAKGQVFSIGKLGQRFYLALQLDFKHN